MSALTPDLLEAALDYAARGYAVFPLHNPIGAEGGCSCQDGRVCADAEGRPRPKNAGKHPRTKYGVKDASSDPEQIRAWWSKWPDANIGIATGEPSGIWVLDIDGSVGAQALRELEFLHDDVPATRTARTGRESGEHRYFLLDASIELANRSGKIGAGLDVRTTGGYVVAPPSLHHSGRRYAFVSESDEAIAAPAWLLALAAKRPAVQPEANRLQPDLDWGASSKTKPAQAPRGVVATMLGGDTAGADGATRFLAAIRPAVDKVAMASEGQRNETLNAQAFGLGGLWHHWAGGSAELEARAVAELEAAAVAAEQDPRQVRRMFASGVARPGPAPADRPAPERASSSSSAPSRASTLSRLESLVEDGDVDILLKDPEIRALVAKPGDLAGEVEVALLRMPHKVQQSLRRIAKREARQAPRGGPSKDEHREIRERIRGEISRENKDGQLVVVTTLGTAATVLEEDPAFRGRIRRNELSGVDHFEDRLVDLDVELEIAQALEQLYFTEWPFQKVQNAIRRVGAAHPFHPVRDYLDHLPAWDGQRRIDHLLTDYFGAATTAIDDPNVDLSRLISAYGRALLISLVARARDPGCKVDQVLVLFGPQGALKSTGLAALVPDRRWFHDDALPIHDEKRLGMILRGPWLVELAELASVARADIEAVKSAITRTHDRYVPMFGRQPIEVPRGCVLVATANPDSPDGRGAPEAGRRWWVVWIPPGSTTSPARIAADRDQLFAEALAAYEDGEAWHLPPDLAAEQREDVSAYVESDEWLDAVLRFTEAWKGGDLTGSDLCRHASGRDLLVLNMAEQRRFGAAARAAGWRKMAGGGRQGGRLWRPPG